MTSITTGSTIDIPDDVSLIDDPEDAPYRNPGTSAYFEDTHAFVMVLLYEDMTSSGWYAEVFEEPGEKPSRSKHAADEAGAWYKAIHLALRHELPLVSYSETIAY